MDSRLKALAACRSRESMAGTAPLRRSPTSRPKECPFCASWEPAEGLSSPEGLWVPSRHGIATGGLLRSLKAVPVVPPPVLVSGRTMLPPSRAGDPSQELEEERSLPY